MKLSQEGLRALLDDEEVLEGLEHLRYELTCLKANQEHPTVNYRELLIQDSKRSVAGELYALLQRINHKTGRGLSSESSQGEGYNGPGAH